MNQFVQHHVALGKSLQSGEIHDALKVATMIVQIAGCQEFSHRGKMKQLPVAQGVAAIQLGGLHKQINGLLCGHSARLRILQVTVSALAGEGAGGVPFRSAVGFKRTAALMLKVSCNRV